MRVPRLNLWQYQKSLNKTQKIKRTISQNKPYKPKICKQQAEMEQECQAYFEKQKELEKELQEKMDNALIELRAQNLSYQMLLFYGIKIEKEKIIETLKARKAK